MTSIEWLISQLQIIGDKAFNREITLGEYHIKKNELIEQSKEMHKQEIINAIEDGRYEFGYEYYNDTFVSKGSDETLKDYHIVDTNEMVDQVPDVRKMVEDDVAPIDWLINQLENHIVLSAHNKLGTNRTGDYRIGLRKAIDFCHQAKEMEAKETLYTKEQVIAIVEKSRATGLTAEYIIQSLKQPKKD